MATPTIFDVAVSLFKNAETPTDPATTTVAEVLAKIKKGTWRKLVEDLRQLKLAGKEQQYQNRKKKLPAVTFQGVFSYRANSGFKTPSGFFVCDGDHLPNLSATCEALRADPSIAFFFVSPGKDGVKFGFRIPPFTSEAEYKFLFLAIAEYVETTFQITIDRARSDVAGLCFVSDDPNCYNNPAAQEFSIDWDAYHVEQERLRQEAEAAQHALDEARERMKAAQSHQNTKELKGFEKWKATALDYDIQWMEERVRAALPGDPVQGRHQAYVACGLRIGSILQGYAGALTTESHLLAIVKSIRQDFRPLDERAVLEMIPYGRQTPKTDADLWQRWESWKATHPIPSNGNGNGQPQQAAPTPTDADIPPDIEHGQTPTAKDAKQIYKDVRRQAVQLWKAKRFAEGITCFVQKWDDVQGVVTRESLAALLSQYLPDDQDAHTLIEKTFETPVKAIPGEGTGGQADAIRDAIEGCGFALKYNELKDVIYVNGIQIDKPGFAILYYPLLNLGFKNQGTIESVALAVSQKTKIHPIKDYLKGLTWNGKDHIATLASYFSDRDRVFPLYLRKWLVGNIAKVCDHRQNPMLVFMGAQGLGKGHFCRWLCPIPDLFVASAIAPENKDYQVRACERWIWEVEELEGTHSKADRAALKAFITQDKFTVRRPYGHFDVDKYACASYIGTINDDGAGILDDVTGNRRYRPVYLTRINRAYSAEVDIHQVWAQAYHLYTVKHETMELVDADETTLRETILPQFKREDPLEDLIQEFFIENAQNLLSSTEILAILFELGYKGKHTRADAMDLANVMKALKIEKGHDTTGKKRGYRCTYVGPALKNYYTQMPTTAYEEQPFQPDPYAALIQ